MAPVPDDRVSMILDRLRGHGGRVTGPRRRVIEAMVTAPSHHMTAAEVVNAVRADDPDFYESTVYRTLDRLVELAVVERVQLGPGATIFHLPHRPHHHLVCERCGEVTEAPAGLLDDVAERARAEHGFTLRPAASTLVGLCRRCSRSGPRRAPH
jgi:Fur family ferric uptake transcriptional regulator